ncbi:hypothetical protein PR202_ga01717 [Eleusine coracana subsp. coracana]|uniref:Cyclin C-terminal domain-containing protein n=1 Tax=Eleusine coracana subsp. coracana TaxID=191504 RepID=A0AAV5BGE3_ELECO|nr:hypothetical protein PR202_ga01030 [Eleusine coracana subsp. coracana]GJM85909.1 hypothetical protein PR202_ga01717 [Eleusine coracana subsp. coracana]
MTCTVAPFAVPAGCFIGGAVLPPQRTTMMAACAVEQLAPPSTSPCSYDDGVEMETLLGNIHDLVHQQSTTPQPSIMKKKKKMDPSWTYDTDIDATFRKMEKDPAERPSSEDYLSTTQQEGTIKMMTMVDRADLVAWMYAASKIHRLPPGTLHRAVSYVDRYLSVKKIGAHRQRPHPPGRRVAVFVAAKYEESAIKWGLQRRRRRPTTWATDAHGTRHNIDEDTHEGVAVMRALAHHLADVTLLDYRCVSFLPSAVAASAILLARRIIINSNDDNQEEELHKMTRYKLQDLTDIIHDIYDMHELQDKWPGCALIMANCVYGYYCLPARWC